MRKAKLADLSLVVELLSASFESNPSVDAVVRPGKGRSRRIRGLMEYAFLNCLEYGRAYIDQTGRCCALVMLPDRKRSSARSLWRDLRLAFQVIGPKRVLKVLTREARIKKLQQQGAVYYLWFIGTDPASQGEKLGTAMMDHLLREARAMQRTVILETSVPRNLYWYQRLGFEHYQELDLGYRLHFLRSAHAQD